MTAWTFTSACGRWAVASFVAFVSLTALGCGDDASSHQSLTCPPPSATWPLSLTVELSADAVAPTNVVVQVAEGFSTWACNAEVGRGTIPGLSLASYTFHEAGRYELQFLGVSDPARLNLDVVAFDDLNANDRCDEGEHGVIVTVEAGTETVIPVTIGGGGCPIRR